MGNTHMGHLQQNSWTNLGEFRRLNMSGTIASDKPQQSVTWMSAMLSEGHHSPGTMFCLCVDWAMSCTQLFLFPCWYEAEAKHGASLQEFTHEMTISWSFLYCLRYALLNVSSSCRMVRTQKCKFNMWGNISYEGPTNITLVGPGGGKIITD